MLLSTLVIVCLSARLSWIWSPPEETQVYVLCDCTSGFQSLLCYISYVGSPAWVILNKPPFTSICLSVSLTSVWQIDSYRQKKKKTTTREWEGMGVILPGVERDFPTVFSWDWDGKRLKFVMHFGNRRWAPGLMRHLAWETRSQRLTFSHYLGSTHILNDFGRIQMSHFNLD